MLKVRKNMLQWLWILMETKRSPFPIYVTIWFSERVMVFDVEQTLWENTACSDTKWFKAYKKYTIRNANCDITCLEEGSIGSNYISNAI